MKRILMPLFFVLSMTVVCAQSLKKYAIGNSGCSAYFLCKPDTFSVTKSQDSSDVYNGECQNGETYYGVICVKLKEKISDMETSEQTLIAYLDYLKQALNINTAAGYGKGYKLRNREDTRGVIDYWQDKDKDNWKVKGWTDGKYIAVMYAYSKKELEETKVNVFFSIPVVSLDVFQRKMILQT